MEISNYLFATRTAHDHQAWFFGSSAQDIPRHAAYSVGFSIVAEHRKQNGGMPASRLRDVPAEAFYRGA